MCISNWPKPHLLKIIGYAYFLLLKLRRWWNFQFAYIFIDKNLTYCSIMTRTVIDRWSRFSNFSIRVFISLWWLATNITFNFSLTVKKFNSERVTHNNFMFVVLRKRNDSKHDFKVVEMKFYISIQI